ncbi:hypothetical protein A4X03_0g8934, partial [Tilletia caries]
MSSSSTRAVPEMFLHPAVSAAQICNSCIAERQLIASLRSRFGGGGTGAEALLRNNGVRGMNDLNGGRHMSGPASRTKAEAVYSLQGGRYLVYKPPNGSPRVAKECVILRRNLSWAPRWSGCRVLCYFHRACIDSWFKNGRACPVHARTSWFWSA